MESRAGGRMISFKEGIAMKRLQYPGPTKVMTVHELSDYLHCHRSTIYRLLRRNQIPAFRVGGDWRFNVEEIDRWRLQREKLGD
jgi:excisionase family DNA binding protein